MIQETTARAGCRDGELMLAGGAALRFPAMWLRDSCPCAECADPASGQKLHDVTDIPLDCAVTDARNAAADIVGGAGTDGPGGAVAVTFAPDGHRSVFAMDCRRRVGTAIPRTPGSGPGRWNPCSAGGACCCATCRRGMAW